MNVLIYGEVYLRKTIANYFNRISLTDKTAERSQLRMEKLNPLKFGNVILRGSEPLQDVKTSVMKPCLFCSSEAVLIDHGNDRWYVDCSFCNENSCCYWSFQEGAIDAWNNKPERELNMNMYTKEEILFLLDESISHESIMKCFGFPRGFDERRWVHAAKRYAKIASSKKDALVQGSF